MKIHWKMTALVTWDQTGVCKLNGLGQSDPSLKPLWLIKNFRSAGFVAVAVFVWLFFCGFGSLHFILDLPLWWPMSSAEPPLGHSILAFFHPLLVSVNHKKLISTPTGGTRDVSESQYPSQKHKHVPGLSKRSFVSIEWHPRCGRSSLDLLIDWGGFLHGDILGLCKAC